MPQIEIVKGVYSVGAIDWDRTVFDELIPLPEGTSYNAYLIKGSEKTALIDTVDPAKTDVLLANLKKAGVERIDYIVASHAEQDHSGSIPAVLEKYPDAVVVTNAKCRGFLMDLLHIPEGKFVEVKDGEELSLGDRTLRFLFTPWVHWPETMSTYLVEDRILFTCDFFGSHLATSKLFAEDHYDVYTGAKRYYAEIMMPFRTIIRKNVAMVEELNPAIIAPSHGPLYRNVSFIIDAYKEWLSDDTLENMVVIGYVSMHDSTRIMAERLASSLIERGVHVKMFNLVTGDTGEFAMSLVDAATLIIATPTVLSGPHPAALYATYLASALRPKMKFFGIMGSYGWGGRTADILNGIMSLKVERLEPLLIKGLPDEDGLKKVEEMAENIRRLHEEAGLIKPE